MDTVFILNAWDSTCDKLNGADKDGDTFFTTDNPVILRNVHFEKPIMCIQSASSKIIPKEKDFVVANKRSFGNMVGTITNYATSMYTVIVNFEEGTPEWEELRYRITCMQDFQQNSIDLAKGIEYRPVPKEWYDWKVNKIDPEDSEEVVKEKFGGMYTAFQYGAPPHGGCAFGLDRLVQIMLDEPNLRQVVIFPTNQRGQDLMMGAPTTVTEKQLREVHIQVRKKN